MIVRFHCINVYDPKSNMAAIYFFIWAAFVWGCFLNPALAENDVCPSDCSCLGSYVDCSRTRLSEVPKDLPSWVTDL